MSDLGAGAGPSETRTSARGPVAPPGNPTFPLADAVRAIAILGVIICHVAVPAIGRVWWGRLAWQGQIGVDIFFALSGFLLYRPYVAARFEGRSGPSAMRFLRRRTLRIVPAYWVALTVLAIWPGLPGVFTSDWWRYYFFLQVYPGAHGAGLGVAWTLCIEVTFYLFLPIYAAATAWLVRPRREGGSAVGVGNGWLVRELLLLGLLSLGSLWVRQGLYYDHLPGWTTVTLLFQWDYFALGMALAAISVAVSHRPATPRPVRLVARHPGACLGLALAGLVCLWHFAPLPDPNVPQLHLGRGPMSLRHEEFDHFLIAVISLLVLTPMVVDRGRMGLTRRLLGSRAVLGLGAISYSVYLWHSKLLGAIVVPLVGGHPWLWWGGTATPALFIGTCVITLPVALVSYRLIELPSLRRRYPRAVAPASSSPHVARSPINLGGALGEGKRNV